MSVEAVQRPLDAACDRTEHGKLGQELLVRLSAVAEGLLRVHAVPMKIDPSVGSG